MTHDQWQIVVNFTDLGDSAVTGSLMVALSVYLFFTHHRRAALVVITAYLGTALAITLGKVWIYSGCANDTITDLKSPSGHAALSFAAYGIATIILCSSLQGRIKKIAMALGFCIPVIIAISRVILRFHTISDIFIGASIGSLACLYTWWFIPRGEHVHFNWRVILPAGLLVILALHGLRFPGENVINHISNYLKASLQLC